MNQIYLKTNTSLIAILFLVSFTFASYLDSDGQEKLNLSQPVIEISKTQTRSVNLLDIASPDPDSIGVKCIDLSNQKICEKKSRTPLATNSRFVWEAKKEAATNRLYVEFSINEKFIDEENLFEVFNADIKITYKKASNTTIEGDLSLKIAPRFTKPVVEINNKPKTNDSFELVEDKPQSLTLGFKLDGADKTLSDVQISPAPGITITGGNITASDSSTTLEVKYDNTSFYKTSFVIAKIRIVVLKAINEITTITPSKLFMTEGNTEFVRLKVKDAAGNGIPSLKNVTCSSSGNFVRLVKQGDLGYIVKSSILNRKFQDSNGNQLDPPVVSDGKATITCEADAAFSTSALQALPIEITIQEKKGDVVIESLNGNTLLPNGSLNFLTRVFDNDATPVRKGIDYSLENEAIDKQWVAISPQGEKLTVTWVNQPTLPGTTRPEFVNINVRAILENGRSATSKITIHMASVAKFAPLKVKLNIMDQRTAGDLYGDVTKDEYYVLMVRLFNDLKDPDTKNLSGKSILAYSSSIEVAVGLEKKYDKKAKTGNFGAVFGKKQVKALEKERRDKSYRLFKKTVDEADKRFEKQLVQFRKLMTKASKLDQDAFQAELDARLNPKLRNEARKARVNADQAYEDAIAFRDKIRRGYQDSVVSLPSPTVPNNTAISDGKWYPASRQDLMKAEKQDNHLSPTDEDSIISINDSEPNCIDTITYRPFTFEMVVNTVDRRDERTLRSRIFKVLRLSSFGLSTITSIAVPGEKSDFPLAIEKFGNVAVPGLEELFPSLKEQHRQNIVAQVMKPIEEIPFGSDITRVLFIPKKPIKGLIVGHKARINQVCPFYFKVKVAIVSKGGEVVLGSQTQ